MRGLINLLDTYLRIPSLLVEVILYLLGSLYAGVCAICTIISTILILCYSENFPTLILNQVAQLPY